MSFLAWIGLVPLLFAIDNKKPIEAFLTSYLTGILFFLGIIWWLIHVTLLGMVILAFYLALYFGLFGLLANYFLRCTMHDERCANLWVSLATPAAWVASEWLRSNILSGFGWALLAHSQSFNLPVIQIADIFGAYGVSFLVVMVNAAVFLTLKNFRNKEKIRIPVIVTVFLVFASLAYGYFRLNNIFMGETLRIGVVQGNIPQEEKWDASLKYSILRKYEALTRKLAASNADLIIWPETSVPAYLESEGDVMDGIKRLVRAVDTPLLVGTLGEDKIDEDLYYNSAILFSGTGSVIGRYDKLHLVPFGEYVPFKKTLSFVEKFAPAPIGDVAKGREYTVFKFFVKRSSRDTDLNWSLSKAVKFSALICFEDMFPELSRRFVKEGANFLVNMTNDAWYKYSSAPYQHAQGSVFRAVENRVNVVRAANTGFSCFIDMKGRVVDAVYEKGKYLFIDGFRAHDMVVANNKRTFYNICGDIFAYLCMFISAGFVILTRRRR